MSPENVKECNWEHVYCVVLAMCLRPFLSVGSVSSDEIKTYPYEFCPWWLWAQVIEDVKVKRHVYDEQSISRRRPGPIQ